MRQNFQSLCSFMWRRQWHPTPVLLPGKSHGWRNLVGCSPWGREESDTTERLHFHFSLSCTGEGNGNPLQCSCLENPRDREAWWAAIYGVAQSWTRLKGLSSSSNSFYKDFNFSTSSPTVLTSSSSFFNSHLNTWVSQSVSQFSLSVMSNSLPPHGLQHARLPCPSPTLGACSNSCPMSQWCHPTIISSVVPFSSCLQSFPASGSFPMSQFFTSGGQSTAVSASASVLPMNTQD